METMREMDLSPTQREQVDAIVARFQASRSAFEQEHGEARRALEKQIRESGPETAEGKEARQKMKALAEQAPRPEASQQEAFALLTPAQQETFRKSLAEREARFAARQQGRRGPGDMKDMEDREGMRDGAARPPRGGPDGGGDDGARGGSPPRAREGAGASKGAGDRGAPRGVGGGKAGPPSPKGSDAQKPARKDSGPEDSGQRDSGQRDSGNDPMR